MYMHCSSYSYSYTIIPFPEVVCVFVQKIDLYFVCWFRM
jgi:hypothetical protein